MSEKQPQFNQIEDQLSNNVPAAVLVERTNGQIHTGHVVSVTENRTNVYLHPIGADVDNEMYKNISSEKLSDEHQQKLAEELAGVALRGVESDNERFDAMFNDDLADFTPEDAAVRTETNEQRLQRERRMSDERDAAMKRIGRPEMH